MSEYRCICTTSWGFVSSGSGNSIEGLLHDASEAYLTDIVNPVKARLSNYREIEDRIMKAIARKFHFKYPFPSIIKYADVLQLSTEAKSLIPSKGNTWNWVNISPTKERPLDNGIIPSCLDPTESKILFLSKFKELTE